VNADALAIIVHTKIILNIKLHNSNVPALQSVPTMECFLGSSYHNMAIPYKQDEVKTQILFFTAVTILCGSWPPSQFH
jgi:hypothetical protein